MTMTEEFFMSQARRLGGLEFVPQTSEAWAELAKVLKRMSKTQNHAKRIIDRFLEEGAPARCPTPGEVMAVARNVNADPSLDRPELPGPCNECEPFGGNYRMVVRNEIEAMGRCECPRGKKLQALSAAPKSGRRT
jgi:hypothetical protein